MPLTLARLKVLARAIVATGAVEVGCDDCLAELDSLAELELAGKEVPVALRLVAEHIVRCPECAEELTALLAGLRALGE